MAPCEGRRRRRLFPQRRRPVQSRKEMLRTTLLALFAASLFAQADDPFNRPPADVDRALRARIQEFYQFHIKGDFRHAEALVAEDTKDFFYSANKTKYLSAEISRIQYSDNFTKAKATILCEQYVMIPSFPGLRENSTVPF